MIQALILATKAYRLTIATVLLAGCWVAFFDSIKWRSESQNHGKKS